ncbi:MAG: hypothetical protein WBG94_04775 [Anaerolineales bacterium]
MQAIAIGSPVITLHMRKLYITALNFEVGHVLETGKGLQLAMALTAMKWNEIID